MAQALGQFWFFCELLAMRSAHDPLREHKSSVTLRYMTPAEYAANKLAVWKRALEEQRDCEAALALARKKRNHGLILELLPQVEFLRTKADLLLADAVMAKCLLGEQAFIPSEWLITAPGETPDNQHDED